MPQLYFNQKRYADLPLHHGKVPIWLAQRMSILGGAIVESVILEYGRKELMQRLSDPLWFQALGCVLGMDWHSSGITTSVMGALKKAVNPRYNELGIYICGGRGKYSRQTPAELMSLGYRTGLNGNELVRSSRLTAKIDNTAIQDGFQIYLHSFIVSKEGEWTVVQQGLNDKNGMARRYHWNSTLMRSYINDPHTFIYGRNQGTILNLADSQADAARLGMLQIVKEEPEKVLPDIRKILMPMHHHLTAKDVDLKRLGSVLVLAYENQPQGFEDLLLLEGLGPRTLQSLALVSEVIHGAPIRFTDPARFSFAHGGKDGHPFPVPLKVYDKTIEVLQTSIDKAKLGDKDKSEALKNLHIMAESYEENFEPEEDAFEKFIEKERRESYKYGGKTVFGDAKKEDGQLRLF